MKPTEAELQRILEEWQTFAQRKVFAFRGITDAAYALYAPDYFRAILERSAVVVLREDGRMVAAIIYEPIHNGEATIVHWAWTHYEMRNQGLQHQLWSRCGLSQESNVFISHLTVLSEKLAEKYGWLYSPFSLYRLTNEKQKDNREILEQSADSRAG